MSLTLGTGPFGSRRGSYDAAVADHVRYWEPWPRRMRAVVGGRTLLDSRRGVALHETGAMPRHLYPRADLDAGLLRATGDASGGPSQWDVVVGDRTLPGVVRALGAAETEGGPDLDGFVEIEFGAVDRWFEEDDPVYAHVRDPYHRVDVRSSSQHVVVRCAGQVVADSHRPRLLFETSLPVRYYLPFADVDTGALELSETVSECPYKGDGQHWHLSAGGQHVEDAAWSLPQPLPEAVLATEHVCFYPDRVELVVDGERVTS